MAKLRFYPDSRPGFSRRRAGRSFAFYDSDGALIRDPDVRSRILALGIPPAWTDVWVSPFANGHLQATGRDAKGRKQYRYHADWSQARSETKYANLVDFGQALPELRRWIDARLRGGSAGDRQFAVAAVLALIDRSAIRVGNEAYAAENGTFGATTLQDEHLDIDGSRIHLSFPGKGGKPVDQYLTGRKLARVLHQLADLPGGDVFAWLDRDGQPCTVGSDMVNEAIREVCGETHSAKSFRTWNGTHAAFEAAHAPGRVTIKTLAEAASARLHNTPTICRGSYIHPAVIGLAELDEAARLDRLAAAAAAEVSGLRKLEPELIAFLRDA